MHLLKIPSLINQKDVPDQWIYLGGSGMLDLIMNSFYILPYIWRESLPKKDIETIEKLFSKTEDGYIPHNVIGIQYVESAERIDYLNELILQKNKVQKSNVLMVYRYHDDEFDLQRVRAYCITPKGLIEERNAIFNHDQTGYCYMCFDEDFAQFQKSNEYKG